MDSRSYKPFSVAHPGETVSHYLEAFGWSQSDLSRRTGLTAKTISEICNGKASISPTTALAFEKVFARPAHFWLNLQSRFDEVNARVVEAKLSNEWAAWFEKFPIAEMRKRGWISHKKTSTQQAINDVLRFFGVSSPDSWNTVWEAADVVFRQTRRHKINEYAIAAWVRAIEVDSESINVKQYDESALIKSLDLVKQFTRLSIDIAFEKTQSVLADCGVAFVIEPALPDTGISGCTRWVGTKKVIVAISLRYKTDDQIWFTLFHELGHVLKHRRERSFIVDNAEEYLTDDSVDPEMQRYEEEANRFAADTLIPANILSKFISYGVFTNESIHDFAEAINIAPGIVVGRLQYEGVLQPHQGNSLKQKISISYPSSEAH